MTISVSARLGESGEKAAINTARQTLEHVVIVAQTRRPTPPRPSYGSSDPSHNSNT